MGELLRRIFAAAVLAATVVVTSGCASEQPTVSEKVQKYYDENVANAKASVEPNRAPTPTVAFLGDSYTSGTGADPVTLRWTSQLSAKMHWTEVNAGQGGTGYASQGPTPPKTAPYIARIQDVAAANPSVIVVSGGRNDLSVAPAVTAESVAATYRRIRDAMPNVKIIALNPMGDDDAAPRQLSDIANQVRAAVESAGGGLC